MESKSYDRDVAKLARGAGVTFIGRIGGRGLYAIGQVILARLLGPAAYGLYGIGWTTLRVISNFTPLGLQHGVIQFGSRYWERDEKALSKVIFQSLAISFAVGLVIGMGLLLLAPWLAVQWFNKPGLVPVFRFIALAIPFASGLRIAAAATRITQRTSFSVLSEDLAQSGVNLLLFIVLFSMGYGILGALWAVFISFAFALGLALYFVVSLFQPDWVTAIREFSLNKELILFSLPTAATGIFNTLINQIDRFFAGYFLSAAQVGIYHGMSQSSFLFQIILGAFNAILAPMIARFYADGEMDRLQQIFKISTKWGLYIGLPLFVLILLVPQELLRVVFGAEYARDPLPLVILSAGQLTNVATGSVAFLLIMTGQQVRWMQITGTMVVIEVLLNLVLVPAFGLNGSAIATSTGVVGVYGFGLIQVRRTLGFWPYDRRFLKGIFAAVAALAAGFLITRLNITSDLIRLLLVTIVVSLTHVFSLLIQGLDQEDIEFLSLVRKRARGLIE